MGGSSGGIETADIRNKQQKALWRYMGPWFEQGLKQPPPIYPGKLWAGPTEQEQDYFSFFRGMQDLSGNAPWQVALNQALSGKPAYEITPEASELYFQQAIKPTYTQEWTEKALPQLRSAYAGPGYYGSARAMAETKSAQDLATVLGATHGDIMYKDEMARRDLAQQARNLQAQTGLGYSQFMGTFGKDVSEMSRAIEQERMSSDFQRWLMGEPTQGVYPAMYNPYIQLAMTLLGIPTRAAAGMQGTSSPWVSIASSLIGAGGSMGAAALA